MRLITMVFAASLCVLGPANAAQLIVNGGFEFGNFQSQGFANYDTITFDGSQDLTGWTVGNSLVWGLGASDINTFSGLGFVDLTGVGDTQPHGVLNQSIATIIGEEYTFSVFTTLDLGNGGIDVSQNGSTITLSGTYGYWDRSPSGAIWGELTGVFTASSTTTEISIAGWPAGSFMIGLDNVSVTGPDVATPVAEPATWALMILSFAGLGLALRRAKFARS